MYTTGHHIITMPINRRHPNGYYGKVIEKQFAGEMSPTCSPYINPEWGG